MTNKELIQIYKNFCYYLSNKCVDINEISNLPGENSSFYTEKIISDNVDIFNKEKYKTNKIHKWSDHIRINDVVNYFRRKGIFPEIDFLFNVDY